MIADVESVLVPKRPNDEGEAICHVRWMIETPAGWLGAWDRQAFDAYVSAVVATERERGAQAARNALPFCTQLAIDALACLLPVGEWPNVSNNQ